MSTAKLLEWLAPELHELGHTVTETVNDPDPNYVHVPLREELSKVPGGIANSTRTPLSEVFVKSSPCARIAMVSIKEVLDKEDHTTWAVRTASNLADRLRQHVPTNARFVGALCIVIDDADPPVKRLVAFRPRDLKVCDVYDPVRVKLFGPNNLTFESPHRSKNWGWWGKSSLVYDINYWVLGGVAVFVRTDKTAQFNDLCVKGLAATVAPGCSQDYLRCHNVGGRCYYMSALSFLNKAAHTLSTHNAVAGLEPALSFAFKMTACGRSESQRLAVCQALPPSMRPINKRYAELVSSNKQISVKNREDTASAPVNEIEEGGYGAELLIAIMEQSAVPDRVQARKLKYYELGLTLWSLELSWSHMHVVIAKAMSNVDKQGWSVLGGTMKILKSDFTLGHSIAWNVCSAGVVEVCDPNNACVKLDMNTGKQTPDTLSSEWGEHYIVGINIVSLKT